MGPDIIFILVIAVAVLLAMAASFNTAWIPGPLDAGLQLESAVTRTADNNGTAKDLGQGYAPGGPGQAHSVVIETSALDLTSTDETYNFTVQQSPDNSTWTTISAAVPVTAVGAKAIPVFVSARYVRLVCDVGGTTPSITYSAHLVPHQC